MYFNLPYLLAFEQFALRSEMCSVQLCRRLAGAARPRSGPWVLTLACVNVTMSGDALLPAHPAQYVKYRGSAPHWPVTGLATRGAEISTLDREGTRRLVQPDLSQWSSDM